ncbi:hypothetical protein BDZ94DRAFT_1237049 [Collybia nuda]|uniref:Uncharacterized protein n=1 Tax=Collybia nuda TaxID=64659 RepID=A0A9P5Y2R3_9AGAR|nr:hypothetical protein BDZ94DRAFT_1237049 [Collybia nuda]
MLLFLYLGFFSLEVKNHPSLKGAFFRRLIVVNPRVRFSNLIKLRKRHCKKNHNIKEQFWLLTYFKDLWVAAPENWGVVMGGGGPQGTAGLPPESTPQNFSSITNKVTSIFTTTSPPSGQLQGYNAGHLRGGALWEALLFAWPLSFYSTWGISYSDGGTKRMVVKDLEFLQGVFLTTAVVGENFSLLLLTSTYFQWCQDNTGELGNGFSSEVNKLKHKVEQLTSRMEGFEITQQNIFEARRRQIEESIKGLSSEEVLEIECQDLSTLVNACLI